MGIIFFDSATLGDVFETLIRGHSVLSAMLQGGEQARTHLIPVVDMRSRRGILVWAELYGFVRSATQIKKAKGEVALGFVFATAALSVCSVLHYLLHEDWKPGLLSAFSIIMLLGMMISVLPLLIHGFLVNLGITRLGDLVTGLLVEVSTMICYDQELERSAPAEQAGRSPR